MDNLLSILNLFALEGEITEVKPLGNGLINDTYKAVTAGNAPDYVLQRINNAIFQDVDLLQFNIDAVTRHIRKKLEAAGEKDLDRKVLRFVPLKDSPKTYTFDGKSYWRVSVFIPDAFTYDTVDPKYSRFAGEAFGNFEAQLADIPEKLGETIPDFHNMELRARQLEEAVAANKAGRLSDPEVQAILAEIRQYSEQMCMAERLHREGKLPKRICHCDTKVNNMMFDAEGRVLCVIDLDTVMPSFVFSDFGDFLRTAANTVAEDDPAVEKVAFRRDIFEAFAQGYIKGATFLTPIERDNLPYGTLLFPYMQAVRFFADYLNGDTYYKIKYPEHNLVRTRNQMALFRSVLANMDYMKQYIASL
ncbi:MAG: aminoglycoside phosphotransferase family protein [Bacteroidales bacterium]|nr:aminoglycoside phosphotransferase family protein [Bacteroidales bacterium]